MTIVTTMSISFITMAIIITKKPNNKYLRSLQGAPCAAAPSARTTTSASRPPCEDKTS